MTEKEGVVTADRFSSGFTYQDYIAQIKVNKDQFEKWSTTCELTDDDKEFFRKAAQAANGAAKLLVLGEDWCPDVYRGLPVMAQIAEAAGIELRFFPRDENLDIMDQYLKKGEFRSIPTAVFFTDDQKYLCHWSERPALADEEQARIRGDVSKEMPDADEQGIRAAVRGKTQVRYPVWQQETVKELRQMLSDCLGI